MAWSKGGGGGSGGGKGPGAKGKGGGGPSQAEQQAKFPGHTIDPKDVAEFTKYSAIKETLYHHTRSERLDGLYEKGIDLKKTGGTYGQGLYVSTHREIDYGASSVTVALDVRRPWVGTMDQYHAKVSRLSRGRPADDARVRTLFLRAGHDAVVIDFQKMHPGNPALRGVKWVSILKPETARFSAKHKAQEPR